VSTEDTQSSGVDELIGRLRDEGVAKGHDEAEALAAEARKKAVQIIEEARQKADEMLAAARDEAAQTKASGEESLRLACRDAVLKLRESLNEDFASKVRHLVSHTLGDRQFLERLLLEIARKAMPEDAGQKVEVLLPDDVVTAEELQCNPEELSKDSLSCFVLGLAGDILRDGLSFGVGGDDTPGVRIKLVDEDIEIELTDETLSSLLMQHLVPRFRAIMDRKD